MSDPVRFFSIRRSEEDGVTYLTPSRQWSPHALEAVIFTAAQKEHFELPEGAEWVSVALTDFRENDTYEEVLIDVPKLPAPPAAVMRRDRARELRPSRVSTRGPGRRDRRRGGRR